MSNTLLRPCLKAVTHLATVGKLATNSTCELLRCFWWEELDQHPYSFDLVSSDFHLFGPLKNHLNGKRFNNDMIVQLSIMTWLHGLETDFCYALVYRWNKCLVKDGDYVPISISALCVIPPTNEIRLKLENRVAAFQENGNSKNVRESFLCSVFQATYRKLHSFANFKSFLLLVCKFQVIFVTVRQKSGCDSLLSGFVNRYPSRYTERWLFKKTIWVRAVEIKLDSLPDSEVQVLRNKFQNVFGKNSGYNKMCKIAQVLEGVPVGEIDGVCVCDIPLFKYARLTSCDVERSFSQYKSLFRDNRHAFVMDNLEMTLVVH
ncbi:hypothetical protein ANN_17610 [Periplaneta americana]|uniref:Uncharacterized protein n=1 Tax=Periplaneta americana TaxID=6978 RepID=A0ABQ8SUM8_PERAM|nr:hypothetical protein ANN_17610 [Periplaneta americana]